MPFRKPMLCLGLLLATPLAADAPQEIQGLLRQLGDPSVEKREEAQKRLADLGKSSPPAVWKSLSTDNPDPEIRERCKAIRSEILESWSRGLCVLRGEIIPPPHTVEIKDDAVRVNGRSLKASRPPPPPPAPVDPKYVARHEASQRFGILWEAWIQEGDLEAAREKALAFWKAEPLVEEASLQGGAIVRRWKGEAQPEYLEGLCKHRHPSEPKPDPKQVREGILDSQAKGIRRSLEAGSLVVVWDEGKTMTLPAGDRQGLQAAILAILESDAGPEDQARRIQALFQDERAIMGILRPGKR